MKTSSLGVSFSTATWLLEDPEAVLARRAAAHAIGAVDR
jgi:hypothetical protein